MSFLELEQNFFGREETLSLLKRRVVDLKEGYRQNIALLGNQYVGKSATVIHFLSNIEDENLTYIYLDLENKDYHYFVHAFTSGLLHHFLKNKQQHVDDDLSVLMETAKRFIPQTVQVIAKVLDHYEAGKFNESFLGLLALLDVYSNESGKLCLLILDEFQNLNEYPLSEVFQILGKKIMTQKKCFYILISSYEGLAKRILTEQLSLLFGNFEVIAIEPFDLNTSQDFIEHNLQDVKIGVQLRNFLTDFTGGHPLYLNMISRELTHLSALHNQNEIYMPILAQAIENTLFDRWGVISRHFELCINEISRGKGNQLIPVILLALANGVHKLDHLSSDLKLKKSQISQKLSRLIELGIIVKNSQFHYFKDKLFRYWMKYVYQKRLKSFELEGNKQRKQLKDELNQCVDTFKLNSRKNFSTRIVELLSCFENESFQLNGRRYKLPFFEEIVPLKLINEQGQAIEVIKARTKDGVWIVATKKEHMCEGDVNAIALEAKNLGLKPDKCLLVSLAGLDENARLKALQERFWIWNEDEINTLLTVFDKPFILR